MIKKQKYKRKRKNPKYVDEMLIDTLRSAFLNGDPYDLKDALVYYNQGEECDDCGKDYTACECEWCEDCNWKKCLCDLDITVNDWHIATNTENYKLLNIYKKKKKKATLEFAKKVLTKEQLK